jgi:PKD repeat protein
MTVYTVVLRLIADDSDALIARIQSGGIGDGESVVSIHEFHDFVPVPPDLQPTPLPPAEPVPLVAAFEYTPTSPLAADTVQFDATASTGDIATYDWDYGDGTTAPNGGPTPTYSYGHKGTRTVTLTVTDVDGNTNTAGASIQLS